METGVMKSTFDINQQIQHEFVLLCARQPACDDRHFGDPDQTRTLGTSYDAGKVLNSALNFSMTRLIVSVGKHMICPELGV
jgi:hypothetical protein